MSEDLEKYFTKTKHARTCRCDTCNEYWARERERAARIIEQEANPASENDLGGEQTGGVATFIGVDMSRAPKNPADKNIETDYRPDSLVSRKKNRIKGLVDAHWQYVSRALAVGQGRDQTFSWDQVMEMRKFDYTSAARHFYGHGYDDAVQDEAKK